MSIEVSPDWWKSLFDEVYLLTDARSVCDPDVTRLEVDVVSELLPLKPDNRILDLCGGHGRHSIELAGRGYLNCTVLDYSHVLLDRGRKAAAELFRHVVFVQGDATDTGQPEGHFDHVLLLGNSLGYLPDTVDDLQIMHEAMRILKPGGWLLVDVTDGTLVRERFNPNAWHEIEGRVVVCRQRELADDSIRAREIVICKKQGLVRDQSYAIRIYDAASLENLIRQAGFADVSVRKNFCSQLADGDYGFMNHRLIITARKP